MIGILQRGLSAHGQSARSMRRLLTPNRSLTQPDNLMRPSSSSDSIWLCIRTRSRVQLMLGPRHRGPQPLFGVGHETDDQLAGDVAPQQALGVSEVPLAPFRRSIGVGLR
jgi:hypothetical protein